MTPKNKPTPKEEVREVIKNTPCIVKDYPSYKITDEAVNSVLAALKKIVEKMKSKPCKHNPPQMSYCCEICDRNDLIQTIADLFDTEK